MIVRRAAVVSGALSLVLLCTAHVGSPDTWYEGAAGPYKVRVLVRAPPVIPARAEIVVRVLGCGKPAGLACGVKLVTATSRLWNGGARGAPPPDSAVRVPGDSALWSLQLWIMRQGSFAVLIHVDGAEGAGTATVPFAAQATQVLGMKRAFGLLLAVLGVFLAAGLVTIAGAATREATLAPGAVPDPATRARASRVRWITTGAIVLFLVVGRAWWNLEHRAYEAGLYQASAMHLSVRDEAGGARVLRVALDTADARAWNFSGFVPDHGKLMHLFAVRDSDMGALAHLHPVARDSVTYESALPALPPGRYRVFADVVQLNGFAETMVSEVDIAADSARWTPSDADDASFVGSAGNAGGGDARFAFGDGMVLTWERAAGAAESVHAGEDARLRFVLRDSRGAPATVEPYLGMAAHAVVVREDGSVFVHLHPAGTASRGAQRALEEWSGADTVRAHVRATLVKDDSAMAAMHGNEESGTFEFPYAFPKAGRYRVWVQFRRGGVVRTAPFDVAVGAAR